MRIFDNPNHPGYGPVRRLWIVLVQLDLLDAAERMSAWGVTNLGTWTWDATIAESCRLKPQKESHYQRAFIGQLLEGWV